ncbi:hypothetical protein [Nocardia rhizosphaerihabitans]|uniref:hypothetical protein n=1 Tax=Nocardia rhizosphaerihabitans TaxID=1691570 RepID=UPI001E492844|nr:hypothetical protein [Nocardia rhizosphaerihabitans]
MFMFAWPEPRIVSIAPSKPTMMASSITIIKARIIVDRLGSSRRDSAGRIDIAFSARDYIRHRKAHGKAHRRPARTAAQR